MASVRQVGFPRIGAEMEVCSGGLLRSVLRNNLQEEGKQDGRGGRGGGAIAIVVDASVSLRGSLRLGSLSFRGDPKRVGSCVFVPQ